MTQTHVPGFDLNLLPLLDALFRFKSVTLAGRELGLSQSRASRALGRLREALGDPLFVAGSDGLLPTPRAIELQPRITEMLRLARGALVAGAFVPEDETEALKIMMPDHLALALGPLLLKELTRQAPRVDLVVRAFGLNWREQLATGEVDLAFGVLGEGDGSLRMRSGLRDPWVVVLRQGHPATCRRLTAKRFAACDHGMMTVTGGGMGHVDRALAKEGLSRRVRYRGSSPLVTAMLAAQTDLVVTTTALLARSLIQSMPLEIHRLPVKAEPLELPLVWHERSHEDARHKWFRGLVQRCLQAVGGAV